MVHGGVVEHATASSNRPRGGTRVASIRTLAAWASAEAGFSGQHPLLKKNQGRFKKDLRIEIYFAELCKYLLLMQKGILSDAKNALALYVHPN